MPLFRPYQRPDQKAKPTEEQRPALAPNPDLVRSNKPKKPIKATVSTSKSGESDSSHSAHTSALGRTDGAEFVTEPSAKQPLRKDKPTPTRKQAVAARMNRLHPQLSKKEMKALERQKNEELRLKSFADEENRPEKVLARNYIDAKWHIAEFMMPLSILLFALLFFVQNNISVWMYVQIAILVFAVLVALDGFLTWRGYKKLLSVRYPGTKLRGLGAYMFNRLIQIRRFRHPAPAVKRGDPI